MMWLISEIVAIELPSPKFPNLVFTSYSQTTSNHQTWFTDQRNYDVIACNYETDEIFDPFADFTLNRRGSKFQNYKYLWDHSDISTMYTNYFILDDDIVIDVQDINCLFNVLEQYNLYALQPSFDRKGKIVIKLH